MSARTLEIPALSLVVLIGATSAGKSTFAARRFAPTEVVSSDRMRGWVCDDETNQQASADAFAMVHQLVDVRLRRGRLTVVDATNLEPAHRASLIRIARERHVACVAVALDLPEEVLLRRHQGRPDRAFGAALVRAHAAALRRSLGGLRDEGFQGTYVLRGPEEVDAAEVRRVPLAPDRRAIRGPFDLVGDVHGCRAELDALLAKLGWVDLDVAPRHPDGRTAVFVGDLVDRGPDSPGVLRRVMAMVRAGVALCVPGNHDARLVKALRTGKTTGSHGLTATLEQLATEPAAFRSEVAAFVEGLPSHLVLDEGRLVVAHAGCTEELQGRDSAAVRAFCLYGDTTGELDGYGLPVRADWAAHYRGAPRVVHGHVPVARAAWVNGVIDLDTGCVFGGHLTALRWPEDELVDVPAAREWFPPVKPLGAPSEAPRPADRLELRDVTGNRRVETRLVGGVALHADQSPGALELVSRLAVDPRWLVHLPPPMSPCDAAPVGSPFLEHPAQAFAHFAARGVDQVVVEEKHAGSRALVLVLRDPEVARARFGAPAPRPGVVLTATGRPFFGDAAAEAALLAQVHDALTAAGRWSAWDTDWALLDAVWVPASAQPRSLFAEDRASAAALGVHETSRALALLAAAAARDPSAAPLRDRAAARAEAARAFDAAWRRRARPSIDPPQLAPFQVLATEGAAHLERDRGWHLAELGRLAHPAIRPTPHLRVMLGDEASEGEAAALFAAICDAGGEGVVVKPFGSVARDAKGHLVQPALKVRTPDALRLCYGPEALLPEGIDRLRSRGLQRKRGLALRAFALGHEALCRFVERRPLHEVHAAVFGVLALRAEPVDPRL
jgi:protein phosphatase